MRRKDESLCEFGGCKARATWLNHQLWGRGGAIRTCDAHRPGSRARPESLRHLPTFYRSEPIPAGGS
jgi:hypothetical protein